jgi:8-oxo-dGTP diphosphatase
MAQDEMFYVVQKAFIKKGNEVLVLNDPKEGLDFPGGKIQEGEGDLTEALKREVREETGFEIKVGTPFITWWESFPSDHELAGSRAFLIGYMCEYISGNISLSDEHNSFNWVSKENFSKVNDGTSYFDILKKYFSVI